MKAHWKERFNTGGICDFRKNYDFYFKWLLNKTASCFYIKNLPDTMDEFYIKSTLLVDGDIGITDFNDKLYAVNGAPSGMPDEYYVPTQYTVANPILGSKIFTRGVDGVVVYNTALDKYVSGGLFGLIDQTATLLADNVISINCNQINSRVAAIFTADSDAQAIAGEAILKKMYTGAPYQVVRSDIIEKIGVNPIATSAISQNITELVELNNYIIANYFQSIGIKSNDIRKKAHILEDEINSQNNYLQISILEILTSWQKGFDEVNKIYNEDIQVELNPALIDTLIDTDDENNESNESNESKINDVANEINDEIEIESETESEPENESEVEPEVEVEEEVEPEPETEPEIEPEDKFEEDLDTQEAIVEDLIDTINDAKEVNEDDSETPSES